ncbi:hypothetical protein VHUM_00122 [Vanrija humicola]|uniref:Uncharacterized protein n=1 Tax=Vanrija humicola TaxID=5417 RepID=A0A7D8Z3N9_VANHU|nr:hypothetical protein VHUM_00122 [Vanrija humicola]
MAHEPGGKKRKVPVPLVPGSDAEFDTGRDGADRNPPRSAREDDSSPTVGVPRRLARSTGALLAAHRRKLFKERKASLVALYLDAQGAVEAAKPAAKATLPDVRAFERLLPALEDVGVWSPDAAGWRDGADSSSDPPVPRRSLERWRTGFARRKRLRADRVPVARGGWAPEGSFELDIPSEASLRARARARERAALVKLADQLRALVLATNKPEAPAAAEPEVETLSTQAPADPPPPPPPMSKKKPKKKKRATLANDGNPHHVDKYRPSRAVSHESPYTSWPSHNRYLFPPSMRLLSARRGEKPAQRPAEDEYICWSCEYALFYGAEAARRHAIKQRKAELRRREKLRARAHDVAYGRIRRPHTDDDDEYDDEEDDGCSDEEGHGKCTCGRAIHQPHEEGEAKPPDKAAA